MPAYHPLLLLLLLLPPLQVLMNLHVVIREVADAPPTSTSSALSLMYSSNSSSGGTAYLDKLAAAGVRAGGGLPDRSTLAKDRHAYIGGELSHVWLQMQVCSQNPKP